MPFVDTQLATECGALGQAYVAREYGWDTVIDRLNQPLDRFLAPRSLYDQLSQRAVRRAKSFSEVQYAGRFNAAIEQVLPTLKAAGADRAERDVLSALAQIGQPGYQVQSQVPVVGRLIAWIRTQLTSHLKEPYLDGMIQRQERFNLAILERVADLAQRVRK